MYFTIWLVDDEIESVAGLAGDALNQPCNFLRQTYQVVVPIRLTVGEQGSPAQGLWKLVQKQPPICIRLIIVLYTLLGVEEGQPKLPHRNVVLLAGAVPVEDVLEVFEVEELLLPNPPVRGAIVEEQLFQGDLTATE